MTSIEGVLAKQAIAEALYSYCRGLDRMDRATYDTVFAPGAAMDYGQHYKGTAEGFAEWVWEAHEAMQAHSHQITNILVHVDPSGDRAASEAYVTVCLRTKPDESGKVFDVVDRGRYLDRWERNGAGEWRVTERTFLSDIQEIVDASTSPPATAVRDRTDPSYQLLG